MGINREEIIVRAGFDNTQLAAGMKGIMSIVQTGFGQVKSFIMESIGSGVLLEGIKGLLEKFDDLKDRAENLGISTDFLQGMSKIAGSDAVGGVKTFNKAITDLSQKLGDAKEGGEASIKNFQKWGITIKEIRDLDTEGMFYRISDAIHAIEDPAIRSAAAFDLLGKSGKNMTGILARGHEDIHKAVDGVTKLSKSEIQNLADAKDQIETTSNWVTILAGKFLMLVGLPYRFAGAMSKPKETLINITAEVDKLIHKTNKFIDLKNAAAKPGRLDSEDTSNGVSSDDYVRRIQLQRNLLQVSKYSPKAMASMQATLEGINDKIELTNAPDENARLAIRRKQAMRDLAREQKVLPIGEAARTLESFKIQSMADIVRGLDQQITDNKNAALNRIAAHSEKQADSLDKIATLATGQGLKVELKSK